MTFKALALLFLVSSGLSAPTSDASTNDCHPTKELKTAKYDDLRFDDGGFNPIPPHYYGLSYTAFQVDQYDGWFPPTSGNQTAVAYGGSGNFSVPDSPPKQTFDLESFSYACIGGIPQPECAISVWGWKPDGRKLFRPITFPRLDPGHYPNEFVMNATTFGKDWQGLKSVGFSIARKDNGGDMYAGLWLDDVKYTITTGC
ncbi:hypothetical protein HBH70_233370 [Parastagonospora nodorum]|nr:hypothetical protein HBI09_199980 [Parastagonospora nodorum]KAH4402389.1 hypothetical protein HBH92_211680 [Parastagonospora nodorum]KAH4413834.1 hypothetical protein HBH93_217870 [Parastagonospora nodorum]KAH4432254.1 hypothetical protein HBH91_224920 [Parastagonospora nodorum]KAH4488780.1 hypothetical protein HBH89_192280 [Parastagonospora nodorum]